MCAKYFCDAMCYMLKNRGELYQAITLLQMQKQEIEMVVFECMVPGVTQPLLISISVSQNENNQHRLCLPLTFVFPVFHNALTQC